MFLHKTAKKEYDIRVLTADPRYCFPIPERKSGNPMKSFGKVLFGTLVLLLLASLLSFGMAEGAAGLQHDIVVLFTSDVHCGIDQNFSYVGLKEVKDALAAKGNHVLLVDDGDAIQGESIGMLTQGKAPIELMNEMGYDVAIPGNHEFDYGMDRFMELAEMANFPYISCNFRKNGERVFDPYIIKEIEGVKIAFVGVSTPETLTSSTPRYFQDADGNFIYDFAQGNNGETFYSVVQQAVDSARSEGAQYVFVLGHLGNEEANAPYTYADLIEHTTGIDAMLDGHSHDTYRVVMKNSAGEKVIRQACGTKLACIGWLRIYSADGSIDTGLYTWNNSVSVPDLLGLRNEMSDKIEEVTGEILSSLSEKIGTTAIELTINDPVAVDSSGGRIRIIRSAETNLGDLSADAVRWATGADVAVVNGGMVRTSIQAGDITINDILAVFPFGNKLMKIEATGHEILDALEWGARTVPEENGAFLHVSGITYEIHTYIKSSCTMDDNGMFTGVSGEYRVKNVMIGGEPLDLEKTYTVGGLSYPLMDKGDGQTAFAGTNILWESDQLDYTYVVKFIRDELGGVISDGYDHPYGQERIVAVESKP